MLPSPLNLSNISLVIFRLLRSQGRLAVDHVTPPPRMSLATSNQTGAGDWTGSSAGGAGVDGATPLMLSTAD